MTPRKRRALPPAAALCTLGERALRARLPCSGSRPRGRSSVRAQHSLSPAVESHSTLALEVSPVHAIARVCRAEEFVAHGSGVNCVHIGRKSGTVMVTGGDDKKVNVWAIGRRNVILVSVFASFDHRID